MGSKSDVKENKPVVEPVDDNDCVVCLEPLSNKADERTLVRLRCGHEFHLDCIGSAFNKKKKMICPSCRQVEKGQWLCHYAQPEEEVEFAIPDFSLDESGLVYDEDNDEMVDTNVRVPISWWSEEFRVEVDSHIRRVLTPNISGPNQIPQNGQPGSYIWLRHPGSDAEPGDLYDEQLARILDYGRLLDGHQTMYAYHDGRVVLSNSSVGTSNGGGGSESSSDGESSSEGSDDGEAVDMEVATDEATEREDMPNTATTREP